MLFDGGGKADAKYAEALAAVARDPDATLELAPDDPRDPFAALAQLCGEWIKEETPLRLPTTRDPKLQAAAAHTCRHLKGGDIAAACAAGGLSERTLRRRFRAVFGMNWDEYRRRARLIAGAALLNEGRLPIGHVAAEVGFESQSAFARAFKALTGKSPREFRAG